MSGDALAITGKSKGGGKDAAIITIKKIGQPETVIMNDVSQFLFAKLIPIFVIQYGTGIKCALKGVDKIVSELIYGTVKISRQSKKVDNQKEVSSLVKEEREKERQTQLVTHLQQLRLRAPNMIRREYQGLLDQVKERFKEDDSYDGETSSLQQVEMMQKTRDAFSKAFKQNVPVELSAEEIDNVQVRVSNVSLPLKDAASRRQNSNLKQNAPVLIRRSTNNQDDGSVFLTDGDENFAFYSASPAMEGSVVSDYMLVPTNPQLLRSIAPSSSDIADTERKKDLDQRF